MTENYPDIQAKLDFVREAAEEAGSPVPPVFAGGQWHRWVPEGRVWEFRVGAPAEISELPEQTSLRDRFAMAALSTCNWT